MSRWPIGGPQAWRASEGSRVAAYSNNHVCRWFAKESGENAFLFIGDASISSKDAGALLDAAAARRCGHSV